MKNIFLVICLMFLLSSCDQVIAFIDSFTTTATTPDDALNLKLPTEENSNDPVVNPENTVTILIYKGDGIYNYIGNDIKSGSKLSYAGKNSISDFLNEKKKQIPENKLLIMIKSDSTATYKNTIKMLDEMTENAVKRYVVMDITINEQNFINNLQ